MGDAKQIVVRPVDSALADAVIRAHHYSGKVYNKRRLSLGVYYLGRLEGALQFGPPLDQRKVMPLVSGTDWQGMMELNRMAFSEALPRNSESRALAVAFRMFRKHRPDIKWILSYSDATQCGDGTIYRASGFLLTGIKRNTGLMMMPDGEVITAVGLRTGPELQRRYGYTPGMERDGAWRRRSGARVLPGYQFRYIAFLDATWRDRLTVPVIPFDSIPADARMYRGKRASPERGTGNHPATGGADPTLALHPEAGDG